MPRVLVVSNRLPISVTREEGRVHVEASSGGLATGMSGVHERLGGLWIGWPGVHDEDLDEPGRAAVAAELERRRAVPVWLSAADVQEFYEGFANAVLWPLLHHLVDQLPLHVQTWDAYVRVNERFADAVAAHWQPGDRIWVHDYQLMLVPRLLRQRLPEAPIGFFLHVPFPASDVFRTLPHRERILEGLLGADLLGFHTPAYMRHFTASLVRVLGIPADVDRVQLGAREVRVGVFPMGIDAARFTALGADPGVVAAARAFRGDPESAVFLGIDRLDYTKGIPRRILAFEQLLRRDPTLRERVRLVQIAVPSRSGVDRYQEFRHQLDALVGRVNGAFATPRWTPVHYLHQAFDEREVAALYRAADVMLVTPLRDGMNLVAKEFVATRADEDGVLVLSEFAGAASELAEALPVNPYDVERTADVYQRALAMPPAERRTRMRALRRRVLRYDVHRWSQAFLDALGAASAGRVRDVVAPTPTMEVAALTARLRAAPFLLLLLDYDGTLVPFADVPDLAAPDAPLVELLRALAARPRGETHVVSGRSHEILERWLGETGVGLHAEHGLWSRDPGGAWEQRPTPAPEWRERVLAILEDFAARTPGALVEEKSSSLAWHYRMADPEFGVFQARELQLHLSEMLSNAPVRLLPGDKVLEVRPHGVHKGTVVAALADRVPPGGIVVAIGDDRTDEELFAALPEGAVAVHVGPQRSRAGVRLTAWTDARRFLGGLL